MFIREKATINLPIDVCRQALLNDAECERLARLGAGEIQLVQLEPRVTKLMFTGTAHAADDPASQAAGKAFAKRLVRHLASRIRRGTVPAGLGPNGTYETLALAVESPQEALR